MTDLTPVVVGGLIAVVGGLIGAWFQSRRENRRWIRGERLEVYAEVLRITDRIRDVSLSIQTNHQAVLTLKVKMDAGEDVDAVELEDLHAEGANWDEILDDLEVRLYHVNAKVLLVAGRRVQSTSGAVMAVYMESSDTYVKALATFTSAARKDLRVPEN